MIVSSSGLTSSTEVLDALVTNILGLPFPLDWAQVYENPISTSYDFVTDAGNENTTNRFVVLRTKLDHNSAGAGDNEYTYIILEDDPSNTRILVRSCISFSSGGTSLGVTPLASAISNGSLDNVTGTNSVHVNGTQLNVSVSLQDVGGFEHVWINPLEHIETSPDATANQFIAMGKAGSGTAWTPTTTYSTAQTLSVVPLSPTGIDQNDGVILLVAAVLGDATTYLGKLKHIFVTNNTVAQDFDRLHATSESDYYFALGHATGTVAVFS